MGAEPRPPPPHRVSDSPEAAKARCAAATTKEMAHEGAPLDQRILSSAISSGMPTFLLTSGVPIVDRRRKRLVSATTLDLKDREKLPPATPEYPPSKPLCLRGHTPAIKWPTTKRVTPRRSVRGPRGARDIEPGAFAKPGVLGGLSVSPWVVEEAKESTRRARSHGNAFSKDPTLFRRTRDEGGLLDYAEEMHAVQHFLDKIHPVRDESCPPKSGFSYRRVVHDEDPPDFYDTCLDSVRPRTTGYPMGHVRALSPTPALTWGGRQSARASVQWRQGAGGSLDAVEASLTDCPGVRGELLSRLCPLPRRALIARQGWATCTFGDSPPEASLFPDCRSAADNDAGIEVRPMWSRESSRMAHGTSWQAGIPRPFSSTLDHLGRPMSRGILSRATSCLKPQTFDTRQRREEYTCALAAKRQARLSREEACRLAQEQEADRQEKAFEEREGIEKFESSLKHILQQKWKYL